MACVDKKIGKTPISDKYSKTNYAAASSVVQPLLN